MSHVSRKTIIIMIGAVVLAVLSCWIISKLMQSTTKSTPIKVGYLPMISSLTYFVALDQGYFVDEGLRVVGVPYKRAMG